MNLIQKLCDELETVSELCYLGGDMMDASGGCEVVVIARVKGGWVRFRKGGELSFKNRFSLKINDRFYHCYVRSAVLC